jgi:hypothetical protein
MYMLKSQVKESRLQESRIKIATVSEICRSPTLRLKPFVFFDYPSHKWDGNELRFL